MSEWQSGIRICFLIHSEKFQICVENENLDYLDFCFTIYLKGIYFLVMQPQVQLSNWLSHKYMLDSDMIWVIFQVSKNMNSQVQKILNDVQEFNPSQRFLISIEITTVQFARNLLIKETGLNHLVIGRIELIYFQSQK